MATIEKLMKALEALKTLQTSSSTEDSIIVKKKETFATTKDKILHCNIVADAICSPNIRSSSDFPKVLGLSMDMFLLCCDDDNSDVRLIADECLNRTVKTLLDSHLGRLLVEFFKEIKKNGSSRSLRAALSRFGDICHLMKPQKCRPYTVNLIPTLIKICHRKSEESLQETLAIAISKLMPVLGQFTNDKDTKNLLKAFLPNLTVNSAIIRRAAATSLTCLCQYSRRPSTFFSWILLALFDRILPVQEDQPVHVILGVLLCFRHLVPHLNDKMLCSNLKFNIMHNEEDLGVTKEQLIKVFEISLYYCHHTDHNVVTSTLETLFHLLKYAPKELVEDFITPNGIVKSTIYDITNLNKTLSESQCSIVPSILSIDESLLEDEQDTYFLHKQAHDYVSFTQSEDSAVSLRDQHLELSNLKELPEDLSEESSLDCQVIDDLAFKEFSQEYSQDIPKLKKQASDDYILDSEDELWNSNSTHSGPSSKLEFKVCDIGSFTDDDVALKYCTRLLTSSFLLAGSSGLYIPDKSVRVSVKSLALGCLSQIFSMYPKAFLLSLYIKDTEDKTENKEAPVQAISDVTLFSSHPDPHIRGQLALLIGNFLGSAIRQTGGCWKQWSKELKGQGLSGISFFIEKLISIVEDDSSVASKLGLTGLRQCINVLLNSSEDAVCCQIFDCLLSLKNNSYWLFKVELIELISSIPFKMVYYLEKKLNSIYSVKFAGFQEKFIKRVMIFLLGDEDLRVRQSAASAFSKLVANVFYPSDFPNQEPLIAIAKEMMNTNLHYPYKMLHNSTLPLVYGLVEPFAVVSSVSYTPTIDCALSRIINIIVMTLKTTTNKFLVYGCCHALHLLSQKFLVTIFSDTWMSHMPDISHEVINLELMEPKPQPFNISDEGCLTNMSSESADLISHLISLITSTNLCLDLVAHHHTLHLIGNILCGIWYKHFEENHKNCSSKSATESTDYIPFLIGKVFLHVMRLLNIFMHVLEDQHPIPLSMRTNLQTLANPGNLSPVKKKKDESTSTANSVIKGSPLKTIGSIFLFVYFTEQKKNVHVGIHSLKIDCAL